MVSTCLPLPPVARGTRVWPLLAISAPAQQPHSRAGHLASASRCAVSHAVSRAVSHTCRMQCCTRGRMRGRMQCRARAARHLQDHGLRHQERLAQPAPLQAGGPHDALRAVLGLPVLGAAGRETASRGGGMGGRCVSGAPARMMRAPGQLLGLENGSCTVPCRCNMLACVSPLVEAPLDCAFGGCTGTAPPQRAPAAARRAVAPPAPRGGPSAPPRPAGPPPRTGRCDARRWHAGRGGSARLSCLTWLILALSASTASSRRRNAASSWSLLDTCRSRASSTSPVICARRADGVPDSGAASKEASAGDWPGSAPSAGAIAAALPPEGGSALPGTLWTDCRCGSAPAGGIAPARGASLCSRQRCRVDRGAAWCLETNHSEASSRPRAGLMICRGLAASSTQRPCACDARMPGIRRRHAWCCAGWMLGAAGAGFTSRRLLQLGRTKAPQRRQGEQARVCSAKLVPNARVT